MTRLPIDDVVPALRDALSSHAAAVLIAPPGAGKTTRVPLALLDEPWLAGGRIIMLEPRRLAARAAAEHMARLLGERVGETVGYRVRMDTRVGPRTRIEVVTEGVLTRMLQSDPALEGVGLVIFDEFHERSLHSDLGLALTLESRAVLREDLRVLVMSATLEGEAVAAVLGGAPIVRSEGRMFPVETRYRARPVEGPIEAAVTLTVIDALERETGDVLVFLPGAAEIRRVEERLADAGLGPDIHVRPLYGALPPDAQDRAIAPAPPGERKVVLATSIAETSLTIEGVRVVVDAGLMRVPRFSPQTGMTRLETVPVTRASAEQRRGRAGRLGPGVCYRLWTEAEQLHLTPHRTPEILEADLAPLALELAAWGVADPDSLRWLDPPPAGAFAQARELLAWLGALDEDGGITPHGRRMAELALHPRLAHMALRAVEDGQGALACEIAALLDERDILLRDGEPAEADLRLRLDALRTGRAPAGHTLHRGALHRVREEARHWRRSLGVRGGDVVDADAAGALLARAFPDRIAQRRPGRPGRFLLRNGRGAALDEADPLAHAEFLAIAELDDRGRESRIFLAAPLDRADVEQVFADQIETAEDVSWDDEAHAVVARRTTRLGALVLAEAPLPDPDPDAVLNALLDGISRLGIDALPWTDTARQIQRRILFLLTLDDAWPDVSDETLAATIDEWLAPYLHGARKLEDVRRLDLAAILRAMLPWDRQRALDAEAPSHVVVPSGSRIPIDYSDPTAPVLAVRLQEMFGMAETPRIANGRVPLTLHLLSPAHRPVQVTRDLASFWKNAYFEVRKDLKGRYPKHHWPDDPLTAEATRRTKPRR